ncbi:uncharacterized protein C6orf118-like [Littorina saxatilis]|uniref:Translin-associated factor X-interacting protein 1 N-terminal domain-containing protein n=1 Tax=Littorina saxatilis TaxID=31220 RepID=A0AAN9BLY2_9CAEN
MAYKFLKSRQLRELLDGAEVKQKKDVHDYSGGHLNEAVLLQHYAASTRKSWETAKLPDAMVERSQVIPTPPTTHHPRMEQALFEFSMGTAGVVPNLPAKKGRQSPLKKYKFLKEEEKERAENGETVESPSAHSLYSELEDGILVEELPPAELMLKKSKSARAPLNKLKSEPGLIAAEDTMFTSQMSFLGQQPRHLLHDLPFNYNFMSMHNMGVTRQDQYRKMRSFENGVLKKKEASEQNVLSGVKAVQHHEKKLKEELEMLNLQGLGINFHKLQVYSNTLEDVINESPTFSYILRCIKAEYDNYIAWLLDHQTSQQHLLREQVEQMAVRGTSRPQEMAQAMEHVNQQVEEAQSLLTLNQRLRDEVEKEKEWLENTPEPTTDHTQKNLSLLHKDQPMELAEEIENLKAVILEKIDEENAMRVQIREEFVPMTVCTHLEQCIKETEVEVQKLLKQNEYFERSIDEMETELKEAIQDADTSEKDARRIWRKVNSKRGIPGHHAAGRGESDDEEEEEESKWNWYIS